MNDWCSFSEADIVKYTMASMMASTTLSIVNKQRLQDPYKMCRLCFQTRGDMDVTTAPLLLQAIKKLYDIDVSVWVFKSKICFFFFWTFINF